MDKQIFNERLGKIMGVKEGEIVDAYLSKVIGGGVKITLTIKPSPKQLPKIKELVIEELNNDLGG